MHYQTEPLAVELETALRVVWCLQMLTDWCLIIGFMTSSLKAINSCLNNETGAQMWPTPLKWRTVKIEFLYVHLTDFN